MHVFQCNFLEMLRQEIVFEMNISVRDYTIHNLAFDYQRSGFEVGFGRLKFQTRAFRMRHSIFWYFHIITNIGHIEDDHPNTCTDAYSHCVCVCFCMRYLA